MLVTCLYCRKSYDIDSKDYQYSRLKNKLTKHYICNSCNKTMMSDARNNVDFDPKMADPKGYEKLI